MGFEMQYSQPSALVTPDQKQMGMFLHLSGLALAVFFPVGMALPIILWQTQKDKIPALDAHGKMVANWMISAAIYSVASFFLIFVFLIGILTGVAVFFMAIIFPIIGGIKANNGELWEYPMTIRFLK